MKFNGRFITVLLIAIVAVLAGSNAQADLFEMTHGNSTARVESDSSAGMYDWEVDGQDHLYQQWFWFRVGDTDEQQSIDELSLSYSNLVNGPVNSQLTLQYESNDFSIALVYSLIGGSAGSGTADIGEQIIITNKSDSDSLDFHFFQYVDFDLCGTIGDDTVQIVGGNTAQQSDSSGCILSETVVTPRPSLFETGEYSDTLDLLEDVAGANLGGNGSFGPGDATWAFQWNKTIAAGGSFIISKDKHLETPEPGLVLLLGLGFAAAGFLRRKA